MSLKSILFADQRQAPVAASEPAGRTKSGAPAPAPVTATATAARGASQSFTFSSLGAHASAGKLPVQPTRPLSAHGVHETSSRLLMMERDQLKAKLQAAQEETGRQAAQAKAHKQHALQLKFEIASQESAAGVAKTSLLSRERDVAVLSERLDIQSQIQSHFADYYF